METKSTTNHRRWATISANWRVTTTKSNQMTPLSLREMKQNYVQIRIKTSQQKNVIYDIKLINC